MSTYCIVEENIYLLLLAPTGFVFWTWSSYCWLGGGWVPMLHTHTHTYNIHTYICLHHPQVHHLHTMVLLFFCFLSNASEAAALYRTHPFIYLFLYLLLFSPPTCPPCATHVRGRQSTTHRRHFVLSHILFSIFLFLGWWPAGRGKQRHVFPTGGEHDRRLGHVRSQRDAERALRSGFAPGDGDGC